MTAKLDLTNQKFGRLTVVRPAPKLGRWTAWVCKCDCGKEKVTTTNRLKSGNTLSCGCIRTGESHPRFINRIGKVYGRLTVIKREPNHGKRIMWLCQCSCGKQIIADGAHLTTGHTQSCGCLVLDTIRLPKGEGAFNSLYGRYKAVAHRANRKFELTQKEFREIVSQPCHYCGREPETKCGSPDSFGQYIYNGIDRVDNQKGYSKDNVVPCCIQCNRAKHVLSYHEFIDMCKRIVANLSKWGSM